MESLLHVRPAVLQRESDRAAGAGQQGEDRYHDAGRVSAGQMQGVRPGGDDAHDEATLQGQDPLPRIHELDQRVQGSGEGRVRPRADDRPQVQHDVVIGGVYIGCRVRLQDWRSRHAHRVLAARASGVRFRYQLLG